MLGYKLIKNLLKIKHVPKKKKNDKGKKNAETICELGSASLCFRDSCGNCADEREFVDVNHLCRCSSSV